MGLAKAHRAHGDEERALAEFRTAGEIFQQIGADRDAAQAVQACADVAGDHIEAIPVTRVPTAAALVFGTDENVFRREGDFWTIEFEGQTTRLHDLRGCQYLARLLEEPGREFHVLDLVARRSPGGNRRDAAGFAVSAANTGPWLDAPAKEAYRRRLGEIEEDIEEAESLGDPDRVAQAALERDFLVRELSHAVGLGGRDRPVNSASERARASVTRAVRHAISRIRQH